MKRTKAFLAFLFCLFFIGIWTISVKAEEELTYGDFTYVVEDEGVTITGYSGSQSDLVIPDSIDGFTVKTIGGSAFEGCVSIQTVRFNEGLETIGSSAFEGCTELTKIEFTDTVKEIGDKAFNGCDKLENLALPQNLETIEGRVFTSPLITEMVIPASLQEAGTWTGSTYGNYSPFCDCPNLKKVVFEEGTKKIADYILRSQESVAEVQIPEGVESIGYRAFYECQNLTEIVLPSTLTEIDIDAFKDCTSIQTVSFNEGLETICSSAFDGCTELTKIEFSDTVKNIGYAAFNGCNKLENLILPKNLESIDAYAFTSPLLTELVIPASLSDAGNDRGNGSPFYDCQNLEVVMLEDGMTEVPYRILAGCAGLKKVQIPESATTIGDDILSDCPDVTIYGRKDSYAQTYANENDIPFVEFDGYLLENPYITRSYITGSYIVDEVTKYTSDELLQGYQNLYDQIESTGNYESLFQTLTAYFNYYGLTDAKEGVKYLQNTNPYRSNYVYLTDNNLYCANNFYAWLKTTKKGKASQALLVADGLIFANEAGDYVSYETYLTGEFPAVKKYKDMLYDFMDFSSLDMEKQEYINNIKKLASNVEGSAKLGVDELVKSINNCDDLEELNTLIQKAETKDILTELTISNDGEAKFVLDENSGFGQFAKASGIAFTALNVGSTVVENVIGILETDAKLKTYEQYRSFLTEIRDTDDTKIPQDLKTAANAVLIEMDQSTWTNILNFSKDLLNASGVNGKIDDAILKEVLGNTTAGSLMSWIKLIKLESYFINQIADVGALTKGVTYVEGYAVLSNHYQSLLNQSKANFQKNPTEANAWDFYEKYNYLYRLRYKGEKAYLKMSKIKGISSYFTDYGYKEKEAVVNDTLEHLKNCAFIIPDGYTIPDSVQYQAKSVISCPVDVEVKTSDGSVIATLKDGTESDVTNDYGRFVVLKDSYSGEYVKVICLYKEDGINISVKTISDGYIDFSVANVDNPENTFAFSVQNIGENEQFLVSELFDQPECIHIKDDTEQQYELEKVSTESYVSVYSLNIQEEELSLNENDTSLLHMDFSPTQANNPTIIWMSNNEEVASVKNGVVTANSVGEATIYAYSVDSEDICDSVKVQVTGHEHQYVDGVCSICSKSQHPEVEEVDLYYKKLSLIIGDEKDLVISILPEDAVTDVVLSTSDESVAIVENNKVIAVGAGNATITATTSNGKSSSIEVNVDYQNIESIILEQESYELEIGSTLTLTPEVKPEISSPRLSFISSDKSVATVDESGVVTAQGIGEAVITVRAENGVESSCTVTVFRPSATAVTLSKDNTTITAGSSETLAVTVSPTTADQRVTWTSSNTAVATVVDGKVTGVKAGTAIITVKSTNGKTATCVVTVTLPSATSVSLTSTTANLVIGNTKTIIASVLPSDADQTVTWKSSNTSVATVSNGKITAVAAGTATITATTLNGKSATCQVTVIKPDVTSVKLNKTSAELWNGETVSLTATVAPTNADTTITWTTSNSSVATVSSGTVVAKAKGTATITATSTNGKTATCTVTVKGVKPTFVSLSKTTVSIDIGSTASLSATVNPSGADQTVTWTTSDSSVATVSSGTVKGIKAGAATITAKNATGLTATCKVTVTVPAATSVSLNKSSATIIAGSSETLIATVYPSPASQTVTWTSSDTSVATVSGGKVTGVKAGSATITAKTSNGKTATCKVAISNAPATGVALSKTSVSLTKGSITTLTASVSPSTASQTVIWTSSDTGIASVSSGKITANSVGTATITAKSADGKASATCKVTVSYASATSVTLNKTSLSLIKGNSSNLTATVSPSNANQSVTWTSSNASVATVSSGKITAVAPGTATITAKSADGKASATCTVTVTRPSATSVTLCSTSASLVIGNTKTITASVLPTDADQTVTWKSSNTSVATVSNGKITAVAAGSANITATTSNGKSAFCKVTVTRPAVTSVTLNKTSAELWNGETVSLTATVAPTNADSAITWTTSNSSVATISGGKVTAKAKGSATIMATSTNGKTAKCTITVKGVKPTSVSLSKSTTSLDIGSTLSLTAAVKPSGSDQAISWTSSNTSVATVSGGTVKGIKAGTATITAKNATGLTATCKVTVTVPAATSVSLNKSSATIIAGSSEALIATVYPSAASQSVTWSSSNTAVATVSSGKVTGIKAGTATITAKTANGKTATCKVTISNAAAQKVTLSKTATSLKIGNSETLTATVSPSTASQSVIWSSSNTGVATVSSGKISAKSVGTATITAKSADGKASATCKVFVSYADVTGVSLNKTTLNLTKGNSSTLTATVSPTSANQSVTWSSSNTSIATVSGGKVTAVSPGSATITAKSVNGKTATCKVTVSYAPSTSVTISKTSLTLVKGNSATLTATVKPSTANPNVTWKTTNSSVVTVSGGKVKGVKAGTVTITATSADKKSSAVCIVTVKDTSSSSSSLTSDMVPIYRLYSPLTGEHLYTSSKNEYDTLYKQYGWGQEGIGWYAPSSGTAVYRLYNPGLKNHLYTTDLNEVSVLCAKYGWVKDNNGEALYYSGGSTPIYRVYNKGLNGMHHLTTNVNEYNTLPKYGWKKEGATLSAVKVGQPFDKTVYYK